MRLALSQTGRSRRGAGEAPARPPAGAYLAVLAAALLCYAALGAVLRALPHHVQGDLRAGPVALGLSVGAPALTAVVTRPLGGWLADRHGPTAILLAGAALMAAGAGPAFAPALTPLVVSRLAIGAGEGLMMSAAVLWLLRLAGPGRRGRALGHIGLANYGGLALGPLLADALDAGRHPARVFAAAALLPLIGAAIAAAAPPPPPQPDGREHGRARALARATLRPGAGLMLVNVGYVALLSFGSGAVAGHGLAASGLIVPVFAGTVIAARTAGAGVPDRAGAVLTLSCAAAAAAAGLVAVGLATSTPLVVAGVVLLAAGQALAVPSLGLLALNRVPPGRQGAAAGLFFSWFDAGVGLGGPAVGALARATDASGALVGAGVAVACAPLVAALHVTRGAGRSTAGRR